MVSGGQSWNWDPSSPYLWPLVDKVGTETPPPPTCGLWWTKLELRLPSHSEHFSIFYPHPPSDVGTMAVHGMQLTFELPSCYILLLHINYLVKIMYSFISCFQNLIWTFYIHTCSLWADNPTQWLVKMTYSFHMAAIKKEISLPMFLKCNLNFLHIYRQLIVLCSDKILSCIYS